MVSETRGLWKKAGNLSSVLEKTSQPAGENVLAGGVGSRPAVRLDTAGIQKIGFKTAPIAEVGILQPKGLR